MQVEKESNRSHAAVEDQKEKVNEEAEEDQQEKEFVDIPGVKARNIEGEKTKERPFKESLAYSSGQTKYTVNQTSLPLGYNDIRKEEGDLGQRSHGPTPAAMKFYVRRKESMELNGEAQSNPEFAMDPTTQSNEVGSIACKGDPRGISTFEVTDYDPNCNHQDNSLGPANNYKHAILEKQFALVKDMGLTYGEDIQKVKGTMLEMEKRDNSVAVERGIKKHQS